MLNSNGVKSTCKDVIQRKVLFNLGLVLLCFVLQAAVPTCFSQPVFTLVRATPAGWWRGPWSSWWAVIPLLSSWGNVSSSRLCPCLILMESSMASELWLVLLLRFVCVPSRSHLQCLCWENCLCPVFYSSWYQSCVENTNLRHGLVCCPAFVRCMWFCSVCGQISQFPGRSVRVVLEKQDLYWQMEVFHSAKATEQNTAAKRIWLGKNWL